MISWMNAQIADIILKMKVTMAVGLFVFGVDVY